MLDANHYEAVLRARLAELNDRLIEVEQTLDERPNPDAEERATERESDEMLESLGMLPTEFA